MSTLIKILGKKDRLNRKDKIFEKITTENFPS